MVKEWNVQALKLRMIKDLECCNNDFERSMVRAIGGREIRELAESLASQGRLTPGGEAIAGEFGFRR